MIRRICCIIFISMFLVYCTKHYAPQKQEHVHYSLKETSEEKIINDSLFKYKNAVEKETGRVIAISDGGLVKEGAETNLGNFVCDAMQFVAESEKIKADVVLMNRGGLRTNLPAGEIKVTHIFELMPFENELVILTIKGEKLLQFVELLEEKKHPFKGMEVKISNHKIKSVTIGGTEILGGKNYTVVTSDYLANGGDGFTFLKDNSGYTVSGIKVRDAIIAYCEDLTKNKQTIKPYLDGRLQISK